MNRKKIEFNDFEKIIAFGHELNIDHEFGDRKLTIKYGIPDINEENWLGIIDDQIRPNKEKWILDKWSEDFPTRPVKDFEFLSNMASRSDFVKRWFADKSAEFSMDVKVPSYFKDFIPPSEWERSQGLTKLINSDFKLRQDAINEVNKRYKDEINKIMNDSRTYPNINLSKTDPIVYISTIGQNMLPLTIVMAMTKYNPAKETQPNPQAYARECLIRYKVALLEAYYREKLSLAQLISLVESNMVK